ncbi:hypothetical protein SynA1825c_01985 [Synechococcus sp. A18-25c]|nr:hypothetical protein SynA1825c_01985 [Synechococcus sp. A18-25c]
MRHASIANLAFTQIKAFGFIPWQRLIREKAESVISKILFECLIVASMNCA